MLIGMSRSRLCGLLLALLILGACTLERAPKESASDLRGDVQGGSAAIGGGSGGDTGGDGDGSGGSVASGNAGDFWGGPCSDDDAATACPTGSGERGNDPSCFDGDPVSLCPDRPADFGGGDGDGDGDGNPVADQCTRVCDDGFYCNGLERCDLANPTSDPDGCVTTGVCASGQVCVEQSQSCAPCADGDDPDGDGHPDIRCGGGDCREGDPNINPDATELCNLIDDDCDGIIDGTNARAGCALNPVVFLMRHVASPVCVAGACQVELCLGGWFDCNQDFADGCEHEINPVMGDCLVTDCLGSMVPDDNDTNNGDPCMQVTCQSGNRSVAPNPGESCGQEGKCSDQGQCVED